MEGIYKGTDGGICWVCQNKKGKRERVGMNNNDGNEKETRKQEYEKLEGGTV